MSETKHSQEPWGYHEHGDTSWEVVQRYESGHWVIGWGMPEADARRIVACVNACKGLSTEALESGALGKALDLLHQGFIPDDPDDMCPGDDLRCPECQAVSILRALGRLK